jgi:energy-coupling factor transport system permease protein
VDLLRSLPLGLYLEQPVTWLHRLDPRVKLFWLSSFLLTPILANSYWRVATAVLLFLVTILAKIPARAWKQQMGFLLLLGFMTMTIAALSPDGLNVESQPRRMTTAQIVALNQEQAIAANPAANSSTDKINKPNKDARTPTYPTN